MASRPPEEFYCEKHDYRTKDSRKAVQHIKGDLIDTAFEGAAKITKIAMGLPV